MRSPLLRKAIKRLGTRTCRNGFPLRPLRRSSFAVGVFLVAFTAVNISFRNLSLVKNAVRDHFFSLYRGFFYYSR